MTDFANTAFALARSTKFTGRLQYLLDQYSKFVTTTTALPAGSPESKALADRVQSDPGGMAGKIAISLVSDPGVRGTSDGGNPADSTLTDDQLDAVIQAVWNSGAWKNIV